VQFHETPLFYDPNPPVQPEPYDAQADDMFGKHNEEVQNALAAERETVAEKKEEKTEVQAATSLEAFTKCELMVQYKELQPTKKLPSTTEIACFWCAHQFSWQPSIIPEREEKGVYRVYGNFCCPECAVSYLLQESMDPHVRWERMALLHRIYDSDGKGRIFPAPARESLELFGGPMSIEQFRATVRAGKVRIDVHMPPMVSILGSIDTKPIDFFDTSLKNMMLHGATPFGTTSAEKKAEKGEEGLRLKRSKPLKDRDSTLDSVMNIQFRTR
jgi:hypothetical protein